MSQLLYLYYLLMSICFGISIFTIKGSNKNIYIFLLLLSSVIIESIVRVFLYQNQNHFFLYHFFTPIEYSFLSAYCLLTLKHILIKKLIKISIGLFWVFAIYTFINSSLLDFPSISNGIESLLLILFATIVLLTLQPVNKISIYSLSEFWIALAILVYFTGTFIFNGAYNYLRHQDLDSAKAVFNLINSIFNCLFYILLSYGLLCFYKIKRFN
jgi:hypothetical protein